MAADYAQVIGVNVAAAMYRCSWWCIGDPPGLTENEPKGDPRFCIHESVVEALPDPSVDYITWKDKFLPMNPPESWATFTKDAAMILARYIGATELHIYGDDMQGVEDCNGAKRGNRDAERWRFEGEITDRIARWLRAGGVTVEWIRL